MALILYHQNLMLLHSSLIKSKNHPFHVTSRCLNREFFSIPLEKVWEISMDQLHAEISEQGLCVHAFVLMSNHFHLLCHTPRGNLDLVMERFLCTTSVKIGQGWESPYSWSLIRSPAHYGHVYKYVYQNPVRAGVSQRVETYPFTTLRSSSLPNHSSLGLSFGGIEGELIWLNGKYGREDQELIRLGLKRNQFDMKRGYKNT